MQPIMSPMRAMPLALVIAATLSAQAASAATETSLASFGTLGAPGNQAGVVADSAGNLYSTTAVGTVGALVKFTKSGSTYIPSSLHSFQSTDGLTPSGALAIDGSGNLYGVTQLGGANYGAVFRYATATGVFTIVHDFKLTDGNQPIGGPVLDSSGAIYGTTNLGDAFGFGGVYVLTPASPTGASYSTSIAYSFKGSNDGAFPAGPVLRDSLGNLYGTTTGGGSNGAGTVYKLTKSGSSYSESVLHSFGAVGDGASPQGGLAMDANGTLYGTTYGGGSRARGTVFKLTPPAGSGSTWGYSALYSFSGLTDGGQPVAGVTLDSAGNIYGTAKTGGANSSGVVFKLSPSGSNWTESVVYAFPPVTGTAAPGGLPQAALLRSSAGVFYGTTSTGGSAAQHTGGVFSITP